jgi:hypothetical protein
MKEFKVKRVSPAEAWCLKHVGPRLYYLHDKIGGQGWRIMRAHKSSDVLVCIEDDKKALMAMLTLSGND